MIQRLSSGGVWYREEDLDPLGNPYPDAYPAWFYYTLVEKPTEFAFINPNGVATLDLDKE